jgi:nucleoside 2-deoxyribosyltransferase
MSTSALVYIASPLGFADSTDAYREVVLQAVRGAGLEPLDPWDDPGGKLGAAFSAADARTDVAARQEELDRLNADAGKQNHSMLERAHAVLAILDGVDVDSGTAAEIGFAAANQTPVVGLRTDKRQTGEKGCIVNLQVEYFVRLYGGEIFASLPEAIAHLRTVAQKRHRESGGSG